MKNYSIIYMVTITLLSTLTSRASAQNSEKKILKHWRQETPVSQHNKQLRPAKKSGKIDKVASPYSKKQV